MLLSTITKPDNGDIKIWKQIKLSDKEPYPGIFNVGNKTQTKQTKVNRKR